MSTLRMMPRILSLLVITTMLFAMLPLSPVRAEASWSGEGTADHPYVITTSDQLYEIRNDSSKHFVLGANINLDVPPYNTGEGWEPISWFDGTLDGQGFAITGLYINRPADMEVGLFGVIGNQGRVSDLKLVNVNVTGNYVVGGLAGENRGGIHQVSVSGAVTGADDEYESDTIGGLVGINQGEISHSSSSSDVTGYYLVGGLSGDNEGYITDSYASGTVFGVEYVGGLTGYQFSNGTINNSHASGTTTGTNEVGGLVGHNAGGISYSYATGEVIGGSSVGGLAGYNAQVISNTYASGKVSGQDRVGGLVGLHFGGHTSNSYASGEVIGSGQTGGLIGSTTGGDITNSYWDMQVSGQADSAGGEGKTTEQLQRPATFADSWDDFYEIWSIGGSGGYPQLRWALNAALPLPWSGEGNGSENDPFLITTAGHLDEVRNYPDAYYELGGDIDLSQDYGAGDGWEPIGTTSAPFIGTIDGKGYRITGLYVNRPGQDEVGLFGVAGDGARISNLRLENVEVEGHHDVGGLVGKNGGDIANVYVSGEVTGSKFVGGLSGAHAGHIDQSYSSSKVAGVNFLGGLVGTNGGTISNSYAQGEVSAVTAFAGGLVGSNDGGTIVHSYATGKVTGEEFVGGLVSEDAGGSITESYWDMETTGLTSSAGSSDEFGKSTVELKQQATYVGWDFDRIWAIDEGVSYPYLQADYVGAGLPWTGSGTEEDPYIVKSAAHLDRMRDHLSAHFKLGADINLDVLPYNAGEGWEPIGTASDPFNGTLDGKGYTITGLFINRSVGDIVGLFGYTWTTSDIANVSLEDVSVTSAVYDHVGGLAGYNNGRISYSSVNGRVEGYSNSGGLVGYNNGHIRYSYSSGEVAGSDFLGGLAGVNEGTILQSYSSSNVNGVDFLGGLVGISEGTINDSYATGDVTAANGYAGGLIGALEDGTINNAYAVGRVTGFGYVGGLVSDRHRGTVTDSYWNTETTGRTSSAGSSSSYGKSTAEMMQQATYDGWDFDRIWEMEEEVRYPTLQWVTNASLSGLTLDEGALSPAFTPDTTSYTASVSSVVNSVYLTATAASGGASLEVNGVSAISGSPTVVPLHSRQTTIEVVVTAYDGIGTKRYSIEVSQVSDASSPSAGPSTEIIHVPVETGHIGSATTVMQTSITRTTDAYGRVRDEVRLTPDQARETARRIAEAGYTTARIMIPDPEDRVSQVQVTLVREAIVEWINHKIDLEIFTDNMRLLIPQGSLNNPEEDIYFRVIPIKEQAKRIEVEQRARIEKVVREAAKNDRVKVVARPMTVETNMPNQPVTLVLPLRDVQLPENAAERARFLQELMIFIEHSDGDRRLVRGRIVEYKDGLLGLAFEVSKFSTFTILHMEDIAADLHNPYIRGYGDGTFKPNRTATRAEVAAMIARNLGFNDANQAAAAPFKDVLADYWAAGAIEYMKLLGLMVGDTTGAFNPNAAITRAEMATIVAHYRQLPLETEEASGSAFTDLAGHWAALEIAASKQAGLLHGYGDGTFRPNGNLTRAEAVAMINRMFGRDPLHEAGSPTFTDVGETHWGLREIEEAARIVP